MSEHGIPSGRGRRCFIAVENGEPVGHVCFRLVPDCRIEDLRVSESAPEGTAERLVRSVMATAANSGMGELSIHSADPSGIDNRACRSLGFVSAGCPCCQRTGLVCLSKRF